MRTATWENIGNKITTETIMNGNIPEEMCFTMHKEPLFAINPTTGETTAVHGYSSVINDKTGTAYSPVSDKYQVVDNLEALGAVQYIENFKALKWGETNKGMQYLIGSLPEVNILGDTFTPHLVFRNSFDGSSNIQMAICPLRIVCQNQISWALKEANNSVNLRHTRNVGDKLAEAHRLICSTDHYMRELTKEAEKYASIKLSKSELDKIISELFPMPNDASDIQKARVEAKINQFKNAYNCKDNQNFKGTGWGLINAYTDFISHAEMVRKTATAEENRFLMVTFDPKVMLALTKLIQQKV